ncbi:hypothetical protein PFISCL1PPCAC_21877, partial [Pristionchus fissidentatus]
DGFKAIGAYMTALTAQDPIWKGHRRLQTHNFTGKECRMSYRLRDSEMAPVNFYCVIWMDLLHFRPIPSQKKPSRLDVFGEGDYS